jgi:NAD(P)-dependent dehydrogenase (short-subunit alcohol dehydrogenase family)
MQVAIITGATRGIGHATAQRFSRAGFRIVNLSRSRLEDFDAHNISVDFSSPEWERTAAPEIDSALAGAERVCVVHNAAQSEGGSVFEASIETLRSSLQVNVLAPYRLNQLVRPRLKPGSSIVFLGSTLSEKAVAGYAPYVIAKHTVVGLMRATCQDLIGARVHTVCVCPGFTDTEMLRARCNEAALTAIAAQVSFGRLIEPSEIAALIYHCAENPALNGAVLHANLGQIER